MNTAMASRVISMETNAVALNLSSFIVPIIVFVVISKIILVASSQPSGALLIFPNTPGLSQSI
jgi:hypothetical protein